MPIETLIFDIDGVLVDFVDLHRDTFVKAFNMGTKDALLSAEIHDKHLNNYTTKEKLRRCRDIFPHLHWDDDDVNSLKQEATHAAIDAAVITDRVYNIIREIKDRGYKLGCYTNTNRVVMKKVLTKLGLWELFDCRLSNQDVVRAKPAPDGYKQAMFELDSRPNSTLIFEDSSVGLEAARGSGGIPVYVQNNSCLTLEFIEEAIAENDMIRRDKCVVTGVEDLEHIRTFANFPVFSGVTDKKREDDILADMSWHISKSRGIIQLNPLVPLHTLYDNVSHGAGTQGNLWKNHTREFTSFISSWISEGEILEIGGGSGSLGVAYLDRNKTARWTIVDPGCCISDGDRLSSHRVFFDGGYSTDKQVHAVVHSHMFEHTYNPHEFLDMIHGVLNDGSLHIFSIPRLDEWVKNKYPNALLFEHTFLLTESVVDELLKEHGFTILAKEYFGADHSVFYATSHVSKPVVQIVRKQEYDQNLELYSQFVEHFEDLVNSINAVISSTKRPMYIFGAHVFTQTLLAFGIDEQHLVGVIDNDKKKHRKRLCGTGLLVYPVDKLLETEDPILILHAGSYTDEIRIQVKELVPGITLL
jgi:HAD superfamily hydrolase (TIGR01509 family)